jgi:hypothetical protein
MYAALERFSVSAQRRLVSNTSSGSFSEIAPMILLQYVSIRYFIKISLKRVTLQALRCSGPKGKIAAFHVEGCGVSRAR